MYKSVLTTSLPLANYVHAQDTTISMFAGALDSQSLFLASVISANPSATTLAGNCPADVTICILADGAAITQTPSTFEFKISETDLWASLHCDLTGTLAAACTVESIDQSALDTTSWTYFGDEIIYVPVTVTAGVEKLDGAATATGFSATASSGQTSSTTSSASARAQSAASAASSTTATRCKLEDTPTT